MKVRLNCLNNRRSKNEDLPFKEILKSFWFVTIVSSVGRLDFEKYGHRYKGTSETIIQVDKSNHSLISVYRIQKLNGCCRVVNLMFTTFCLLDW